jgi:hypothetical protein
MIACGGSKGEQPQAEKVAVRSARAAMLRRRGAADRKLSFYRKLSGEPEAGRLAKEYRTQTLGHSRQFTLRALGPASGRTDPIATVREFGRTATFATDLVYAEAMLALEEP